MTDSQLRERLNEVRSRLSDARDRRAAAKKDRDDAKTQFQAASLPESGKITDMPEFVAAEQAVATLGTIDDEINDAQQAERTILALAGESTSNVGRPGGQETRLWTPGQGWSAHDMLADSPDYQAAREAGIFSSKTHFGTIEMGQVASREQAVAFLSSFASLPGAPAGPIDSSVGHVQPDFRGIVAPRLRPLTLLDVIPTGTTDSNTVEYVQVTAIPQGAVETDMLALKPELGISTVDATAPVRTIAGWIKAARQQLDDVAGIASLINNLLPYEVRRRIEAQILAGDGVGQNIKGLLNTTGVAALSTVAGDNAADAVLRAMTTVILADSDPNFVAMNPLTWQNLLLIREQTNDQAQPTSFKGEYLYGAPGTLATPTLWGLAITPSRIINQNNPLVGDAMGAQILVREGVNIKTSDSDQDDFVRNRVTVLAESRIAFPVWRPSAFAIASF